MQYATFWQRLAAFVIDGIVLSPFLFAFLWLEGLSKSAASIVYLVRFVLFMSYQIYCHGQFGQTVGKYALGMRVVALNGDKISWKQAWLRSSVELVLGFASVVGGIYILSLLPTEDFNLVWSARIRALNELKPSWLHLLGNVVKVWICSNGIVILFNKQRRSLQDFIASTAVINV